MTLLFTHKNPNLMIIRIPKELLEMTMDEAVQNVVELLASKRFAYEEEVEAVIGQFKLWEVLPNMRDKYMAKNCGYSVMAYRAIKPGETRKTVTREHGNPFDWH